MKQISALLVGFLLGTLSLSFAQSSGTVQISKVMTPAQLSETGVSSLTEPQRKALDNWADSYTRRVIRLVRADLVPVYGNEGKHWVDETFRDGAIVVFEDDSVWEIEGTDRVDTDLWLSTTDVTVKKDSQAAGPYKYILRNTEDQETAHAKYVDSL